MWVLGLEGKGARTEWWWEENRAPVELCKVFWRIIPSLISHAHPLRKIQINSNILLVLMLALS